MRVIRTFQTYLHIVVISIFIILGKYEEESKVSTATCILCTLVKSQSSWSGFTYSI